MQQSALALGIPAESGPESGGGIERLESVSPDNLLEVDWTLIEPPSWLRKLDLPNSRTNVRCLLPRTRLAKRVLDIVVASSLLLLTAPLVLLAALAIKLTSRGPIFFSQIRTGLNTRRPSVNKIPTEAEGQHGIPQPACRRRELNYGRPFRIYKLRTMTVADDAQAPSQAQPGDRRVIPAGRFLRKMRIDELPQLVNVLRGEMSMVGPRPECIEYMEELNAKIPNYSQRLGLKPGLTGIAQIEAGYANDLDSYRRKVAFDLLYLQNCCLWNDLKIMARTVKVVFTGFGAL